MNTIEQLVSQLRSRGVMLWVEDGKIRYRSSKGPLLASDVETLRVHKSSLLQTIEQSQSMQDIPLGPRKSFGSSVSITANQSQPWNFSRSIGSRISAMTLGFMLSGGADAQLLRSCLLQLQQRHEPLRTQIDVDGDLVSQRVEQVDPTRFPIVSVPACDRLDLSELRQERIDSFMAERIETADGTVFDAKIFRFSEVNHVLVMSIDHIVTDGISNEILSNDLWSLYGAGVQGKAARLAQIHLHFQDYAEWQWKCFPTWMRRHAPYWRQRLNRVEHLHWPVKNHAELAPSGAREPVRFRGDERLVRQLEAAARELRTLPAMAVLAAYVATISRWCDQKDLVVAVVDTGRHRPELDRMVGCLADHLHLRIEVRCHQPFDQLIGTIFDEYRAAYENRDYGWLNLIVPDPAADIHFNYRAFTIPSGAGLCADNDWLKSVTIEPCLGYNPPEKRRIAVQGIVPFKLGATFRACSTFLDLSLTHDGQIFPKDVIPKVGSTIMHLLKDALDNPRQRVDVLYDRAGEI